MPKNPTLIMVKYVDPMPRQVGERYHVEFAGYPQGRGLQHLHAWSMPFPNEDEAFSWIAKGVKVLVEGSSSGTRA